MADAPSNPKRPRPDERRDEDLYFEDGSVILSAKDTDGDLVYFRVHKSVLTKQSPVFKDMFSVPSPPEMEMYDDLPLVHLHDSSKELKAFLQAMYDPSFLPFRRLQTDTPVLVAGPLKLATKYQADILCNRIIAHLEADWPTTLEAWDRIAIAYDIDTDASEETSSQPDSDPLPKQLFPDPIPFISLAREGNLPTVLAIVFYSLCRNLTSTHRGAVSYDTWRRGITYAWQRAHDELHWWPGADQLDITSWVPLYDHQSDIDIFCTKMGCRYPVVVVWLGIVQDLMRSGDPLATIRASARKLDEEAEKTRKEQEAEGVVEICDGYNGHRDEMCQFCKWRLSERLFDLRQTLFDQLPFFFPLSQ